MCSGKPGPDGFTLIELLVVIAIIALLISILVPSLTQAKDLARMTICQANLHHIALAYVFYTEDYDNYMPPAFSYSKTFTWARLISEYAKGTKSDPAVGGFFSSDPPPQEHTLFHCPSEPLHGGSVFRDGYDHVIYGNIREDFAPNVLRCGREGRLHGNWYNTGSWTRYDTLALSPNRGAMAVYDIKQVYFGTHADTFMLAEATYMDLTPGHVYWETETSMAFRHIKGEVADMVFFDGHASAWRRPGPANGYPEGEPFCDVMPYEAPW